MELVLLWRWSTGAQLASLIAIAIFFAVLRRWVRRSELGPWVIAWTANLGALAVTLAFWFLQPTGALFAALRFGYILLKTLFLLYMIDGARKIARPSARSFVDRRCLVAVVAGSLVATILLNRITLLGFGINTWIVLTMAAGALMLVRTRQRSVSWLAAGFLLRALFAAGEAVVFALQLMPAERLSARIQRAMELVGSAHSSFDTGAEWVIALGCVLAISELIQQELAASNRGLLSAQEDLRRVADRDALTGLANRRMLPAVLRSVFEQGATLLFFDLDGFKEINDRHGHQAGDGCLVRFADALREAFRPSDAVIRYGGDEFLVVLAGVTEPSEPLVERLRRRVAESPEDGPPIRFSVGSSVLAPGGSPEQAVREADEAMYRFKASARRGRETPAA